ncbi:uncharacterized protein ATNIH1004_000759 [Aspergillus tanneri]|uniref:Uncharacterized protein n=1 Tax=Aspergillus tanneri TaxID=1220188 RepID=A0A5M9MXN7_9EURO|nr:uncharacterized protein ATNIH1004_000759 [Aspergillus tanneri]KAA8651861.1 hypothetical protein ATNIH1004_000759 [Aspergillus tanneri]
MGYSIRPIKESSSTAVPGAFPVRVIGSTLLYPAIATIPPPACRTHEIGGPHAFGIEQSHSVSASPATVPLLCCGQAGQEVLAHMEAARKEGYQVEGTMFQRSPHCALIQEDVERYSGSVHVFWRESCVLGRNPEGISAVSRKSKL